MRKILLFTFMLILSPALHAYELANAFTYNSRFWENTSIIVGRPVYPLSVSAKFSVAEHDDFDNHIYTASLPLKFQTGRLSLSAAPFMIFDNGNGYSSYGGTGRVTLMVREDSVGRTKAFIYTGAGYARQKADIYRDNPFFQKEKYNEFVYEAGISCDFFGIYGMDISGNIFQYPDGVSDIKSIKTTMNQQMVAALSSTDYIMGMPKASGGISFFIHSDESNSDSFVAYRYIDFNDLKYRHSVLFSTNILVGEKVAVNLAYNHMFIPGEVDRDIFSGGASVRF